MSRSAAASRRSACRISSASSASSGRGHPRTVSCRGIEPVRVLVICTANICRSVMTEAFLARALDRAGTTATVTSAGVYAMVNAPPPAEVVAVMGEHGLDVAGHRARQLAQPGASDLVIGLTREHVREAVVMEPTLLPCAFTLKELARRVAAAGPRPTDDIAAGMARDPQRRPGARRAARGLARRRLPRPDRPADPGVPPGRGRAWRSSATRSSGSCGHRSQANAGRGAWAGIRPRTGYRLTRTGPLPAVSRRTRWTKNVLSSIITSTSASCAVGGRSSSSCACSPPASRSHVPRRAPGSTRRRRRCSCPTRSRPTPTAAPGTWSTSRPRSSSSTRARSEPRSTRSWVPRPRRCRA